MKVLYLLFLLSAFLSSCATKVDSSESSLEIGVRGKIEIKKGL